jgi:hypothetical protein
VIKSALRAAPRLPVSEACEPCGKQRYATEEAALRILRICLWYGPKRPKTEARAYFSKTCGWWHLTSRDDYFTAAAAGQEN